MQQTHMVADVLQLAQVVARDDRRQTALRDVLREQALDRLTHDRVETVERLVAEQVIRSAAHAADDRDLFFHALGERADLARLVESEGAHQLEIALFVELFVKPAIIVFHVLRRAVREKELLIRDKEAAALDRRVLKDLFPVDPDLALVRLQNAGEHAQERRFARAVRANKAVDRGVLHLRADVIDRRDVVKTLGRVIRSDHLLSSPFCVTHAVSCASSAPSERALPARAVISALTSRSRSSRLSPTSETKFPRPLAA